MVCLLGRVGQNQAAALPFRDRVRGVYTSGRIVTLGDLQLHAVPQNSFQCSVSKGMVSQAANMVL